jgi:hypothetical protein
MYSGHQPVPWLTLPSIDFIRRIDIKSMNMVELGSGYSTLFFSERVSKIISYDHDQSWIDHIFKEFGYLGEIRLVDEDWASSFSDFEKADLILIDGLDRVESFENIIVALKSGRIPKLKIIIFDNSDWFPEVLNSISELSEIIRVDFQGIALGNNYESVTSIFFCNGYQPKYLDSKNSSLNFEDLLIQQKHRADRKIKVQS